MYKLLKNRSGIALLIVLTSLLLVVLLANVILGIVASQSRLTHHQVSRIQAYYAAQAGMVYALEKLRTGNWTYSPSNSCTNTTPCTFNATDLAQFPHVITSVKIIFCPSGSTCLGSNTACNPPAGNNFCINTVVNYTRTP